MRTIIYCQTILQCSMVYNLLANKLGDDMYLSNDRKSQERLIEMMHSQTASNVKDHVLQQFSQRDGHLRILVETIAFGWEWTARVFGELYILSHQKQLRPIYKRAGDVVEMERKVMLFFFTMT